MSTDLVIHDQSDYMPVMSIDQAVKRREMLVEYTRRLMVEGQDFGTIPGAGNKKVLLKPGAEKLCTIFGLTPQFEIVQQVERWEPDENGELLFSYVYRCSLYRGDRLLANADGSCNSREKKYRYRKAERICPQCGFPAIIKGKAEYGGGHLCYKNKGGCGAKFKDGDPAIEQQETGQVINTDAADLINTLQKMAQKRALIAATLIGVNASEFFTQDLDDQVDHAPHLRQPDPESIPEASTEEAPHPAQEARTAPAAKPAKKAPTTFHEFLVEGCKAAYRAAGVAPTPAGVATALQISEEDAHTYFNQAGKFIPASLDPVMLFKVTYFAAHGQPCKDTDNAIADALAQMEQQWQAPQEVAA